MQDEQLRGLREKLYDAQVPVDADIWGAVEGSLRRRQLRKIFFYVSSAAAVLIIALTVFISNPQEPHASQPIAEVKPQNLNETTIDVQYPVQEVTPEIAVAMDAKRDNRVEKGEEPSAGISAGSVIAQAQHEVVAKEEKSEPEKTQTPEETASNYTLFNLNEYEDHVAGIRSKERNYSVSLMTNVMPGTSATVTNGIMMASAAGAAGISQSATIEQVSDTRYSLPLNLGVQFQFGVAENLAIGVGLNYTMLRSKYDCLINKKMYNVKQTLHYIGLPVNLYGLIVDKNNFRFYVNAGLLAEKGLRAYYELDSYNSSEKEESSISGILFSINAGLGVEYMMGNTVGLYFEPNLVYFFNSDVPRSIRTDQPLQIKAELGCRFHF